MNAQKLVYTIGEKVSYREWKDGIRFYIRSSSRSDQSLLRKMGHKSLRAAGIAIAFTIPLFFLHTPYLRWPWLVTALLLWTYWAMACYTHLLKQYGLETISIHKGTVSYRHRINHPLLSVQIRSNRYRLPLEIRRDLSTPVSSNALIRGKRIVTSYVRFSRDRKATCLFFHPLLTEQEEMKKRMEDHF